MNLRATQKSNQIKECTTMNLNKWVISLCALKENTKHVVKAYGLDKEEKPSTKKRVHTGKKINSI